LPFPGFLSIRQTGEGLCVHDKVPLTPIQRIEVSLQLEAPVIEGMFIRTNESGYFQVVVHLHTGPLLGIQPVRLYIGDEMYLVAGVGADWAVYGHRDEVQDLTLAVPDVTKA